MAGQIYLTLQQFEKKNSYAFVNYGAPVICIAKNRIWREDYSTLTPNQFTKRLCGILAHETLHIVLDESLNDGFEASSMLDNLFGIVQENDFELTGLWGLSRIFRSECLA